MSQPAQDGVPETTSPGDPEKSGHPVPPRAGFFSRARMLGPVTKEHGDLPLLACSFVTGLVDAAVFRNNGMFVGMQTGMSLSRSLSVTFFVMIWVTPAWQTSFWSHHVDT